MDRRAALERIVKLLKLTQSDSDPESLSAIRAVNKLMREHKFTWEVLLPVHLLEPKAPDAPPPAPPHHPPRGSQPESGCECGYNAFGHFQKCFSCMQRDLMHQQAQHARRTAQEAFDDICTCAELNRGRHAMASRIVCDWCRIKQHFGAFRY